MRGAIADGAITVDEHDMDLMYEVQPHQASKKQGLNARLKAMEDSASLGPIFRNLRLDEAQAQKDQAFFEKNRQDTYERIEQGLNKDELA